MDKISKAAAALGKIGGKKNTDAQNKARAANGAKGGRPRGLKIIGGPVLENDVDFKRIIDGFEIFADAVSSHGITTETRMTWGKKRLSLEWGDMGSIIAH